VPVNALFGRVFGKRHGYRLSSVFVEWMMGYPDGWTDIG
jgi:hypothetical protein